MLEPLGTFALWVGFSLFAILTIYALVWS